MLQRLTDDTMLTGPQLRARFGNISDMTVHRWLKNDALGFPQPTYINNRRYWRLGDLVSWENAQASKPKAA